MSRFRVRDLWPELPFELRVRLFGRLIMWGQQHATPPITAEVFARILAREGLLRVARDHFWEEVAAAHARHKPDVPFEWPAPERRPLSPSSRAALERLLADLAAGLPPKYAELPAAVVENIAEMEFGAGAPPEAYVEWMLSTGSTLPIMHLLLSDLIHDLVDYLEEQAATSEQAGAEGHTDGGQS